MLEQRLSYREIARRLNVDPGTVVNYEKRINSNVDSKKIDPADHDLVKDHRHEWIQLQKDFPFLSKTELRKKKPAVFAFLYRHDRDWLNSHSPKQQKVKQINSRVDWVKRIKRC